MQQIFPLLRFHCFRFYRSEPGSFFAFVIAVVVLAAALIALFYATNIAASEQAQLDLLRNAQSHALLPPPSAPDQEVQNLPWFQSAQLVEEFSRVAKDNDLPLDEVGYALEDGANHPYLRYRITLSVTAAYPTIRKFADDLVSMKHVDLDSISCSRPDIVAAALSCELAFSAFFRKDANG